MKTAVIGASGFIGSHLLRCLRSRHADCLGTCFRHPRDDLTAFDLRKPDIAPLRLLETGHESVVVAAAESSINACEREPAAEEVNVRGTLELLGQLGSLGLTVVFLSSDNVFDGQTGGYTDASPPDPQTAYGRHKLTIEREIGNLCERYSVVRLSKTFGLEKGDGTLLDEMAAKLAAGQSISAAYDLIFSPTWVEDVVRAIIRIQDLDLRGIINVACPEAWSRYDLAIAVANALGTNSRLVRRITFADLGITAHRPLNTSLSCERLQAESGIRFRAVQDCVDIVASNWKSNWKEDA